MTTINDLTEHQKTAMRFLRSRPNGFATTSEFPFNNLVATSVMMSLERRGLAHHFPSSNDEWSVRTWALSRDGKELQSQL